MQGMQEIHRKFVLAPTHNSANIVVVACWLHYVNSLTQGLHGTKAYVYTSVIQNSVLNYVNLHCFHAAISVKENQERLLTLYFTNTA